MENKANQIPNHYAKISSLLFLRNRNRLHRMKMKKEGKMICNKKNLRQQIYQNNNIFQMMPNKLSRKSAQNIIWLKNYKLKMSINIFRQQNSSLKAKQWNIQKQNRKMDKQIEAWNLEKVFKCTNNKPYIDMMTVSKVFADQDYQIVSNKIDIAKYQRILDQKQEEIQKLISKNKEYDKYLNHSKHVLGQQKFNLLKIIQSCCKIESCCKNKSSTIRNNLNYQVVQTDKKLEFMSKNLQIKKKINLEYKEQLQILQRQINNSKKIDQNNIDKLKQSMREIKLQQKNDFINIQKGLKQIKRNAIEYECQMQEDTCKLIARKIQLKTKIEQILENIESQLGSTESYQKQIKVCIEKINQLYS